MAVACDTTTIDCDAEQYKDAFSCDSGVKCDTGDNCNVPLCQCVDENGEFAFVVPDGDGGFTVDDCGPIGFVKFGPKVKYGRLLDATNLSPWVRIGFQKYDESGERCTVGTNSTVITTGNLSQPGIIDDLGFPICDEGFATSDKCCHASIKAFQYGFGNIDSGNKCKVTIMDEKGSSFTDWIDRITVNVEGASKNIKGSYQMKVQWGWYGSGGGENDKCGQPAAAPGETPAAGENSSFVYCSPILWFLPTTITVQATGNKFIYELEAVDLLRRGEEYMVAQTVGSDDEPQFFVDAVNELACMSTPPFRVAFKTVNSDGTEVDGINFAPQPGEGLPPGTTFDELIAKGPFRKWRTAEQPPLAVVRSWLTQNVTAILDDGSRVGIVANYDSTFDCGQEPDCDCEPNKPVFGQLILWASALPRFREDYTEEQIDNRVKAFYVVNGGACSAVYSFTPQISYPFLLGFKAGGQIMAAGEKMTKALVGLVNIAGKAIGNLAGRVVSGGRSMIKQWTTAATTFIGQGTNPALSTMEANMLHQAATFPFPAIMADLQIQGDPADFYCTPVKAYGRTLGIIFINPFFLNCEQSQDAEGCQALDSQDGCPEWRPRFIESGSTCNSILTNKGWFITGVEHQIKEGSYVTNIKLQLPAPGNELYQAQAESPDVPVHLGGWGLGGELTQGGTVTCLDKYPVGATAVAFRGTGNCGTGGALFTGGGSQCDGFYET